MLAPFGSYGPKLHAMRLDGWSHPIAARDLCAAAMDSSAGLVQLALNRSDQRSNAVFIYSALELGPCLGFAREGVLPNQRVVVGVDHLEYPGVIAAGQPIDVDLYGHTLVGEFAAEGGEFNFRIGGQDNTQLLVSAAI